MHLCESSLIFFIQAHSILSIFAHSILPFSVVMKTFETIGLSFLFRIASARPASFCRYIFRRFFFSAAIEVCFLFAMDSLDEAMANKNHTSIASEKKKRINIQWQKEAGRALAILKREERPMVSKVFITTENGRIECANKEKIEWVCIKENQRRFTQVHDTSPP